MWNGEDQAARDSHHLHDLCCEVGVTEDICKLRCWHSDYMNSLFSLEGIANYNSDLDFVFLAINCGSSAEGVALERLGSDYNVMMVVAGTRITPQRQPDTGTHSDHIFKVLQTFHPSYVRLQCVSMGTGNKRSVAPTPSCCMSDEQGRMILAGKLVTDVYSKNASGTVNGPAVSSMFRVNTVKPIMAIHSPVWPLAAREWAFRVRRYVWPSVELKKFILQHGCHVVPIGNPESEAQHLEWRWSFSLAEKLLVRTFNVCQLQCYFLLKLTVTYLVNPQIIESLTSYHVKTIMLHMVENTHPSEWSKERLSICFMQCLKKLHQSLEDGSLPHYFISNHNLFSPVLQGDTRIRLTSVVAGLVEAGWQCVMQCLPPNMHMLLARHRTQVRCDCYDMHWGGEAGCESAVSMVERCYTLFNATIRVILRLTERPDLTMTIEAMNAFLEYPTFQDTVHFPDIPTTAVVKNVIKGHMGFCYLGLLKSYPYNRASAHDVLPTGQSYLEEAAPADAIASKLKLATFYYMTDNTDECIKILMKILRQYNEYIVNTTGDKTRRLKSCKRPTALKRHRSVTSLLGKAPSMLEWAALEMTFSPWEVPFAPEGIQMLKERQIITDDDVDFKGFVFVDAIVYAYFLLTLSYNNLHRPVHRQQALENLNVLVKNADDNDLHFPDVARFLLPYCKERKHRNCLLCHVRMY